MIKKMEFIKNLTGGKRSSVQLYKSGNDFVVRKEFNKSNYFDFYKNEKETLYSLNHTGLTPKLLDYNDEEKSIIMSYIPGNHITTDFKDYKLLAERLSELHSVHLNQSGFSFRRNPEVDLTDILKIFDALDLKFSTNAEIELKKKYIPSVFDDSKTIHGSLIPSNILVNQKGIYFVDLEMTSKNNAFLDLAYLSTFIPKDNVLEFITNYASITHKDEELAKKEFDYSRYHLCALTLGLFLKDFKNNSLKDEELIQRTQKLAKHLSNDYFLDSSGINLRKHFKNIYEEVKQHV
jgi:serine/threonine protein kinase